MTIHRPGLPSDLPAPEVLWARWALVAVAGATTEGEETPFVHRVGAWIDDGGLHYDDGLDCGMGRFVDRGDALSLLREQVDTRADAERLMAAAEAYRLTPAALAELVTADADGGAPDLPAMARALRRAGLEPRTAPAG